MPLAMYNVAFDCADAYGLAQFWSRVTGFQEDPENPNSPDDPEAALIATDGGPNLFFQNVPEPKVGKNRAHVCFAPTDRTRDEAVRWVIELGATQLSDHRRPDGTGWVIMADPEGNEFCVLRSAAERH